MWAWVKMRGREIFPKTYLAAAPIAGSQGKVYVISNCCRIDTTKGPEVKKEMEAQAGGNKSKKRKRKRAWSPLPQGKKKLLPESVSVCGGLFID